MNIEVYYHTQFHITCPCICKHLKHSHLHAQRPLGFRKCYSLITVLLFKDLTGLIYDFVTSGCLESCILSLTSRGWTLLLRLNTAPIFFLVSILVVQLLSAVLPCLVNIPSVLCNWQFTYLLEKTWSMSVVT